MRHTFLVVFSLVLVALLFGACAFVVDVTPGASEEITSSGLICNEPPIQEARANPTNGPNLVILPIEPNAAENGKYCGYTITGDVGQFEHFNIIVQNTGTVASTPTQIQACAVTGINPPMGINYYVDMPAIDPGKTATLSLSEDFHALTRGYLHGSLFVDWGDLNHETDENDNFVKWNCPE